MTMFPFHAFPGADAFDPKIVPRRQSWLTHPVRKHCRIVVRHLAPLKKNNKFKYFDRGKCVTTWFEHVRWKNQRAPPQ